MLLLQRGDAPGAEEVDATGIRGRAMTTFGAMPETRGEHTAAEAWTRRAADSGVVSATCSLVAFLERRGESSEAEEWWRRAATGPADGPEHVAATVVLSHAVWWDTCERSLPQARAMYRLGAVSKSRATPPRS
jgi:TPR repeat protein